MQQTELISLITPIMITAVIGMLIGALAAWFIQHFRLRRDAGQSVDDFRELHRQLSVLQVDKARAEALCEEYDDDRQRLLAVDSITEKQLQMAGEDLATARANNEHLQAQLADKQSDLESMHKDLQDRFQQTWSEGVEGAAGDGFA